MRLQPNSSIPEINLPLVGGGRFNTNVSSPDKYTLIVSYRGLHCPICAKQLQALDQKYDEITERGYDLVAVSMDSEDRATQSKQEWNIENLPIAYDMDLITARELGLFISDKHGDKEPKYFSEPGLFVVYPDGRVFAEYIQNVPFGRPPINDIVDGLDWVLENDYPVRGTSSV